ncbi:hypothetical protein F6V25_13160 [Oryzomonas japonica]|uniref:NHL repeat containing protein n=1 Tax=Oryzomonas japonica TaxID=2603858 RepID=A0A7J4ZNY6_9BACT|nr:hypothetical protein [Oryzomonas japonica]KAB0664481.1 hypothetical protein F6V25_13160 [Oryzomonas japonica]
MKIIRFAKLRKSIGVSLFGMAFASCLAGCAGKAAPPGTVFFPPPPNKPKVQFLTSIADSTDVEGKQGGFSLVVTGKEGEQSIRSISKAYGVAVSKGKIYVCDTSGGQLVIIDPVNKKFDYLKGNYGDGKLKKPVNVALDDDGNIYVVDTMRKEVLVYDSMGNYLKSFGKELEKAKPVDIVAYKNRLYLLDIFQGDIKVLDRRTGRLLTTIGKDEGSSKGLRMPVNFTIDKAGFMYVTNAGNGKVIKLDLDGHILGSFGKLGDGFGDFTRPKGVAVDDTGLIYVADGGHQNVQLFSFVDNKSRLLMFFGDPGLPVGSMNLPAGIAVSKDNLAYFQKFAAPDFELEQVIYVINQYGPAKLAIYGLGKMKGDTTEMVAPTSADKSK